MDVDLARTFLAVVETGSFVRAAERVHVTQSTVSMRIKTLEDQLGKPLFQRGRAGAAPTPAGAQFRKHALAIVRVWEQARLEVSLPAGYRAALTVGGPYSLWDGFLLEWLARMRASAPEIAIRSQLGFSAALMQRLVDGTLDIGVMYTPQSRPGFEVELLFEDELALVTSESRSAKPFGRSYVYVDWGPEFQADHSLNFPDLATPGLYIEPGALALKYLLENRCSAYFPRRLISSYLADRTLRPMPRAPVFSYPAYAVYAVDRDSEVMKPALKHLRRLAAKQARSTGA